LIENLSPIEYWKKCWTSSYADFGGRARRAEYGWFGLINTGIIVLLLVPMFIAAGMSADSENPPAIVFVMLGLVALFMLAGFIPGLAVAVRRWHDLGQSGWFVLLHLVPLVNYIVPFYELFADSKRESNQWGTSPKYG